MASVLRIEASAELEDPVEAVERTRRQAEVGGEDFDRLVDEFEAGRVLCARVELSIAAVDGDRELRASRTTSGAWLERDVPPKVEAQVQAVATNDLPALLDELRGRGAGVDPADVAEMFVHVELGPALVARLRDGGGEP